MPREGLLVRLSPSLLVRSLPRGLSAAPRAGKSSNGPTPSLQAAESARPTPLSPMPLPEIRRPAIEIGRSRRPAQQRDLLLAPNLETNTSPRQWVYFWSIDTRPCVSSLFAALLSLIQSGRVLNYYGARGDSTVQQGRSVRRRLRLRSRLSNDQTDSTRP